MGSLVARVVLGVGFWGISSVQATAASDAAYALPAGELSLIWIVPFVGVLLSLALFPLFASSFWHHHYGKVAFAWSCALLIPMAAVYGVQTAAYELLHTYLLHYFPFIIIIGGLFTIAGGIKIRLAWSGTPLTNLLLLATASFIASWVGTTGAAMLFIRPFLMMNQEREAKVHLMIFFIFTVCNMGGSLTALGDPPLLLGFFNGVDFFWPLFHLFHPFSVVMVPLLGLFFLVDTVYYRRQKLHRKKIVPTKDEKITIRGWAHLGLLLGVMGAVLMSGIWKPGLFANVMGVELELQNVVRDLTILCLTFCAWRLADPETLKANYFTWEPVLEVGKIFAAIFITAAPVLAILGAGLEGALAPLVNLVTVNGEPVNMMYFWLTGTLSAFLDNAPTYLVFFHMAGGDAQYLMEAGEKTLIAISAGSVFMGALTYIGNAPNFMIKAIAEINHIKMPGFFGYILWSASILIPLFILLSLCCF